MNKLSKDIVMIVYHFAHRDVMEQLILEYHKRLRICECDIIDDYDKGISMCKNGVCTSGIYVNFQYFEYGFVYNYRILCKLNKKYYYKYVYDKRNNICGTLPKKY